MLEWAAVAVLYTEAVLGLLKSINYFVLIANVFTSCIHVWSLHMASLTEGGRLCVLHNKCVKMVH